jgi:diguanylate cyclase (GGDEF)-like protein
MKPAWHEVVASLETSIARGTNGLVTATVGTSRPPIPMRWHEPVSDRLAVPAPAPAPATRPRPAAAPTRGELLAELELRLARNADGLAVAVVDLDGFKSVNQDQGYAVGDQVLETTLARLAVAAGPGGMAARFGSDEFAVILDGVEPARALAAADRLLAAVSEPLAAGGVTLRIGASAGIACRADAHGRPEDLVRDADRALSRARTLGGGRAVAHDVALFGRPLALADLETALRRALDTDDFREHFQPIVSVKGGQVYGFEIHLWRRSGANGKRR